MPRLPGFTTPTIQDGPTSNRQAAHSERTAQKVARLSKRLSGDKFSKKG